MPVLRIGTNKQGKFERRQRLEKPRSPMRDAFLARRLVAALFVVAWKTEAHRHDGNATLVVEGIPVDAHPLAQPIAGRIVVGNAGLVDANAGRLTDNADLCARTGANDRPDTVLQLGFTNPAAANGVKKPRKFPRVFYYYSPRSMCRAMTTCWIWLVPS
jgi:hypothetical protein